MSFLSSTVMDFGYKPKVVTAPVNTEFKITGLRSLAQFEAQGGKVLNDADSFCVVIFVSAYIIYSILLTKTNLWYLKIGSDLEIFKPIGDRFKILIDPSITGMVLSKNIKMTNYLKSTLGTGEYSEFLLGSFGDHPINVIIKHSEPKPMAR